MQISFLWLTGTLLSLLLNSCSGDSNINQIFVSKAQSESLSSLIEKSQIEYDAGRFDDALRYAEKAEKISPQNEDIGVLLGYIHLALTGMDTFRIAEALIEATNNEKKANALASSNNQASLFLTTLKNKLNLDREELELLGDFSEDEDLDAFKDYPVILPLTADEARESGLNVFSHLNAAIEKICPFVNDGAKTPETDSRHDADHCVASEVRRNKKAVSHFLWAFAHIVEASAFFAVVQYQDEDSSGPHLQLRADALESEKDNLSIGSYVTHALSLADSVTQILDFETENSQFNAVLNDIIVASLAFTQIGNVPYKVKRALDKAITSINSTKESSVGSNEGEQKANALKTQLNSKMAGQLEDKIDALAESDPTEFEENKEDLCAAYETISGVSSMPIACEDEKE